MRARASEARAATRAAHEWLLACTHWFFVARAWARRVVDATFRALGCERFEPRRGLRHAMRAMNAELRRRVGGYEGLGGDAPRRPPRTLSVIATCGEGDGDLERFVERAVNVARWCARCGVERVSVYDGGGRATTTRGIEALREALETSRRDREGVGYVLRVVDADDGGKIRECARGASAGRGEASIDVDALGPRDACAALLDAARHAELEEEGDDSLEGAIASARDGDGVEWAKFKYKPNVVRLERWMRERGTFLPPADVAVVFGATFHLQGYPPWQLHAAELFHEESLDRFSRRDLARVIDKYAKTAQRFGK